MWLHSDLIEIFKYSIRMKYWFKMQHMSPSIRWWHLKESVLRSCSDIVIGQEVKTTVKHYWFNYEYWEPFLKSVMPVVPVFKKNLEWSQRCDSAVASCHDINLTQRIIMVLLHSYPSWHSLFGAQVCSRLTSFLHIVIFLCSLLIPSSLLLSVCPVKLHLQRSPNQICTSRGQFVRAVCGLIDSKA